MRPFAACLGIGASAFVLSTVRVDVCRADTVTVYVFDFDYSINRPGFGPVEDAVIQLGDTVRWEWLADFHTVTSCLGNPEVFDSGTFDTGDAFEVTFTHPGRWSYYCIPHGADLGNGTATGMSGTVTVLPAPGAAGVVASVMLMAATRRRR